jgi:hypothetical protein
MEPVKKIYRSIHYNTLTVTLRVDGRRVVCEFTGSSTYPVVIRGMYATKDPRIQEALEKHSLFKKDFFLESTVKSLPQVLNPEPEGSDGPESKTIEVKDIRSVTKAKEFLNRKYKAPYSDMKNKEQVLNKADELGIVFVDLDTEV